MRREATYSFVAVTCPKPPIPGWPTIIWHAVRPRTLSISLAPVLAGTALAYVEQGTFLALPFVVALLVAMLIQIGTNLHNDTVDFKKGNDLPDRLGPPRVTACGWLTPEAVARAALGCFAMAFVLGIYLVILGGWPILLIGCASLLAGWAYSGGPRPIAYTALGEVFVILFFGILAVLGTVILQASAIDLPAFMIGLVIGLPGAAVLLVNNYRDRQADARAGRRTLALRLSDAANHRLYRALLIAPCILLLYLALSAHPGAVLGLLLLPRFWHLSETFRHLHGEALNPLLGQTAQSGFALSLLLTFGLLLERW